MCIVIIHFVIESNVSMLHSYPTLAIYTPPKQEQAFLQGGTFVFDGTNCVYAHYDESTAAHANVDDVVKLAKSRVAEKVAN